MQVSVELPEAAWSNQTQFRWRQEVFIDEQDHWAIDDVRVFHRFAPGWRNTRQFERDVKRAARADVEVAQCCYFTDQCETYEQQPDALASPAYARGCADVQGWRAHEEATSKRYLLNGGRLYLLLGALIVLYRRLYRHARGYFTQGCRYCIPSRCRRKRRKVYARDDPVGGKLETTFELEVQNEWRTAWLASTLVPLGLFFLWDLAQLEDVDTYVACCSYHRLPSGTMASPSGQPV